MKRITTHSPGETMAVGEALAKALGSDAVVALYGDLGAGKTALVRGLAKGLGLDPDQVSSPTYALVHEHHADRAPSLYHLDLYRIADEEDLESTGFYDVLGRGVVAVEWSERVPYVIPPEALRVTLRPGETENERVITIEGGDGYEAAGD